MDKYIFLREMENAGFKTQREFAKYVGISYKTLNNHLNGITKVSTEDATRYCNALKIHDDDKIVRIFFTQ